MSTFRIPPYSSIDKSFDIRGPLDLIVDNDDVPSDQVAILAKRVVEILNKHWRCPYAWFCENEDCERYWTAVEAGSQVRSDFDKCEECHELMALREVSL